MTDQLVIAGRAFQVATDRGHGEIPQLSGDGAGACGVGRGDGDGGGAAREPDRPHARNRCSIISTATNCSSCRTRRDAIRPMKRFARRGWGARSGLSEWVKLEVIGDEQTLFPETEELVRATKTLVKEGFIVLPYTSDDLIVARKLVDAGASAVMPLGAPIGSGMGIQNLANLRILRERITEVPLIVDAGVGTASDAAIAMELGADGVLMNTAIAGAQDAVLMAEAMRAAVEAGRKAFLAGRIEKKLYATASSPTVGIVR